MNKLAGVHPVLVRKIQKVLEAMNLLGFQMIVTDGVRTVSEQQELYAQGRTKPGKIVTNCDGIKKLSNHQIQPDGYGHAVDCCFLDEKGKPSWDSRFPWKLYGAMVESQNLTWGGRFKNFDGPHAELEL